PHRTVVDKSPDTGLLPHLVDFLPRNRRPSRIVSMPYQPEREVRHRHLLGAEYTRNLRREIDGAVARELQAHVGKRGRRWMRLVSCPFLPPSLRPGRPLVAEDGEGEAEDWGRIVSYLRRRWWCFMDSVCTVPSRG